MGNSIKVTPDGFYTKFWGKVTECGSLEKAIFVNVLESLMIQIEREKKNNK